MAQATAQSKSSKTACGCGPRSCSTAPLSQFLTGVAKACRVAHISREARQSWLGKSTGGGPHLAWALITARPSSKANPPAIVTNSNPEELREATEPFRASLGGTASAKAGVRRR